MATFTPLCWKKVHRIQDQAAYALWMREEDMHPVQQVPFYTATVPVAARARERMLSLWGDDVMSSIRVKQPSGDGGRFTSSFAAVAKPPALPIGHCPGLNSTTPPV